VFYHKKQTREDLRAIQNIIREHGWTQNELGDETIGYCILGAGYRHIIVNEHDGNPARITRILRVLDKTAGMDIDAWNDVPGRTQQEVLDLLDRAIEAV
jgi:hypothetical protein